MAAVRQAVRRRGIGLGLAALGFGGFGAAAFVALSLLGHSPTPTAEAAPSQTPDPVSPPTASGTPILVELFTSEGCSSCPSADVVATKLERTQPVAGARIIVLAHHVDYWNSLGWPDPWSSAAATARQRTYAPLHAGSYTPQAVIDGRTETIGSRSSAIESLVAEAAKTAHVKVDVEAVRVEKQTFDVTVKTPPLAPDTDVLVAVVQDRGRSVVKAGENAGRTLDHTSIARSMTTGAKTRVTLPPAQSAPDGSTFSVVAFVQERASRKILGSGAARFP